MTAAIYPLLGSNFFTRAQADVLARLAGKIVGSGSYLPVASDRTNLDSAVPAVALWTRDENTVTVYFTVTLDPTATGDADFALSLPLTPTMFTDASQLMGMASNDRGECARASAEVGGYTARVRLKPVDATSATWSGSLRYQVPA